MDIFCLNGFCRLKLSWTVTEMLEQQMLIEFLFENLANRNLFEQLLNFLKKVSKLNERFKKYIAENDIFHVRDKIRFLPLVTNKRTT